MAESQLDVERDANLFELQYWPIKIEEWRQEQLTIIQRMKDRDSIVPEVEEALTKSIIKKPTKKDNFNDLAPPPAPKKDKREEMELLDGTLMISVRDPVKVMEKLAMVSEPYLGQFFEYVERTEELVDIKILDGLKVKEARLALQNRVEADSEVIWALVFKEVKKKINLKVEQLKGERIRHFADFEAVNFELDEIIQNRLDMLPRIQLHHENEARFLIDTIHGIREMYSSKIDTVFKEIDQFSQVSLKEIQSSLTRAKSVINVKKVDQKFDIALERFNFDVSDLIEKANLDFDHARKMLEKSKQPGNHSSAWIIVKEASGYDPNTISSELENWKMTIADDLARAQREITTEIKLMQKEIEYYSADLKMMEIADAKIKNLKTLLIGEKIYAQKLQKDLGDRIQKYVEEPHDDHTWENCIQWVSQAMEIETSAIEIAKYLSLSEPHQVFKFSSSYKPSLQSWTEWKTKYRPSKSAKARLFSKSGQAGSRPGSSLLKTPLSAASKSQSRGSTGLSFSQSPDDIINGSEGDSLSTSGKSSRPNTSSRPTSGVNSRPLSANSIGTTPKAFTPDPNLRKSSPARSLRKEESGKELLVLPPLPLKNVDFEAKLAVRSDTKKPFRCLEVIFKEWIDKVRGDILKSYEVRIENNSIESNSLHTRPSIYAGVSTFHQR